MPIDSKSVLEKIMLLKKLEKKRAGGMALSASEEAQLKELSNELRKTIAASERRSGVGEKTDKGPPSKLKVSFKDAEAFQAAYLKNVSGGGIYIETGATYKNDFAVEIEVEVVEPKAKSFSCKGKVVWVNPNPSEDSVFKPGIGVKFGDMERSDQWTLYELIPGRKKQEGEPPRSEKEKAGGAHASGSAANGSGARFGGVSAGSQGSSGGGARFLSEGTGAWIDKLVQSVKKLLKK